LSSLEVVVVLPSLIVWCWCCSGEVVLVVVVLVW
jgi:hypothetical protein